MAKKQIALVLSGGTSLGSYIAGALDELMIALSNDDRYEIDIITGASAGATTGAIIGHGLMYRKGQAKLHDVWVKQIDITHLLEPQLPPGEPPTVLSSHRLIEVAGETLQWADPNNKGQKAPFCADELTLAMTLGNTTELPYVSSVKQQAAGRQEEFVQNRNAEQEAFILRDQPPTDPLWQRIARVARASAAIPFVFPLVQLDRQADNKGHYVQQPSFKGTANFWYYDGGTFNNLPVDLAYYYHKQKFGASLDNRVVVVVNPWRSYAAAIDNNPPHPTLVGHALGLLSAIMNESSALQFDEQVLGRAMREAGTGTDHTEVPRSIPGVSNAPVDLLGHFALVMPRDGDKRLRGNHLHAMGAFLDERFREYDFRRGAADARLAARAVLDIMYDAGRPDGFYDPDSDPALNKDIERYEDLDVPSTLDDKRTVRSVFEGALEARIKALVSALDLPGPDNFLTDAIVSGFLTDKIKEQLPGYCNK